MGIESGRTRTLLITAGEASGDQAAAPVVAALRRMRPEWRILATGGERMEAAGAELLMHYRDLAVMGFSEVIRKLPAISRRFNTLARRLRGGEVDLFLPVDFPGFNLRLAARAKSNGLPVLYYIAPQVWAWGERRVTRIRRDVDSLALVLPFEAEWFAARGVPASFVGHPIMSVPRPQTAITARPRLGLLPGSRAQEVRRLLDPLLAAALELGRHYPDLSVELLESPGLAPGFYTPWRESSPLNLKCCREEASSFLARQGAVIVASGTATLEAAVAGVPMAVVYRTGALNYWLARRLVHLDRIALVNLVASRTVAPEFIQGELTPDALTRCLAPLLRDSPERDAQILGLGEVRQALGDPDCGERVARMAVDLLEERP